MYGEQQNSGEKWVIKNIFNVITIVSILYEFPKDKIFGIFQN